MHRRIFEIHLPCLGVLRCSIGKICESDLNAQKDGAFVCFELHDAAWLLLSTLQYFRVVLEQRQMFATADLGGQIRAQRLREGVGFKSQELNNEVQVWRVSCDRGTRYRVPRHKSHIYEYRP
jgi:hypothetical protein